MQTKRGASAAGCGFGLLAAVRVFAIKTSLEGIACAGVGRGARRRICEFRCDEGVVEDGSESDGEEVDGDVFDGEVAAEEDFSGEGQAEGVDGGDGEEAA